jgi:hypothetical protein
VRTTLPPSPRSTIDGSAARVEHASQVDVDHFLPLLLGHLPGHSPGPDAGVGADDVDLAELGQTRLDGALKLRQRAHIGDGLDRAAPGRLDPLDGLVEVVLGRQAVRDRLDGVGADVDRDYVGALLREAQRV